MGRSLVVCCAAALLAVVVTVPGGASLYQPDEPMVVPVRPDGVGEPLPFDEFKRRMILLTGLLNPTLKNADGSPTDRDKLRARVEARKKVPSLPADEAAALAADMLRLGNTDGGFYVNDALNLLTPRTRDRSPNYFVHTTLAQVHAARGDWGEALNYHEAALFDTEMPAKVKGWTDAQRDWLAKLDRDYIPHYLRIRKTEAEARPRPDPEVEEPTPLFPLPEKGGPAAVRFVTDAGQYEPGALAAAERAKLPPDAVAITQQFLLWFPTDSRLYWLLGELYAAEGKLDEAQRVMDDLVSEAHKYGNRKLLVDHRVAVRQAVEERQRAADQAAADAFPISLRTVWVYFAVVALIAVLAAARAASRRAGAGCWPFR